MQLVKKVWRDTGEDVAVREVRPEWIIRSQSLACELFVAYTYSCVLHCIQHTVNIAQDCLLWPAQLICSYKTTWTPVFVITGHQTLLGMICDIGAQDREYATNKSIGAHHLYTIFPSSLEGLEK
jgi:hypothetical protein